MKEIELYVHIPFCVKKCNYCDFLSAQSNTETRERYVNTLVKEICSSGSLLKEYEVTSIFFGGGTPSLLSKEQIGKVMTAIKEIANIKQDCEITIECNPGTIKQELLETYKEIGVNRLSFGLQSANQEELKLLGRIHTYDQFVQNFNLARQCGFTNINVDLMSALPRQTLETYEVTLRKVIDLKPEHISSYSLIIEEGTKFWNLYGEGNEREHELPSVELDRIMYERSKEILQEAGYERYEISNYAKPSFQCKHNIGYWKRVEYLGFGLGAASLFHNQRFRNVEDLTSYLHKVNANQSILKDIRNLTKKEAMEEFMFLGLRMCKGIDKLRFLHNFEVPIEEVYGAVFQKLKKESVLEEDGSFIKLTDYGIDVSNVVLAEFLIE